MLPALVIVFLVATFVAPGASAQTQVEITHFFEGKSVTARMDIPATNAGIDVFASAPLNRAEHQRRVEAAGIAIRDGDVLVITRVEVKKTLIEFRLKGAGRTVRVNLRYKDGVPAGITPGPIMAALVEFLEFPFNDLVKRPGKSHRQP